MANSTTSSATFNDNNHPISSQQRSSRDSYKKASVSVRTNSDGTSLRKRLTFKLNKDIDDTDEYDFQQERTAGKRQNIRGGIMSLVKSCLGGGIFCIHRSYASCGLWWAIGLNVFLGIAMAFCMYELTSTARRMYARLGLPTLSYPELAEATFENAPWIGLRKYSRVFRVIIDMLIVLNTLCACSVYLVMISRQIKQLVDGTPNICSSTWPNIRVYTISLLLPCLITAMFTKWKNLAPFSIVIDVFIVVLSISTMGYSALSTKVSLLEMKAFHSVNELLIFVGVAMFSMDGIVYTLAVENSLKDPKAFPLVLVIGMSIVVTLAVVIGSFGCWSYGRKSIAPITCNFPWGDFSLRMKMFLIIMMFINTVLHFWVPSCTVWSYAHLLHEEDRHWLWERIYRVILTVLMTSLSTLTGSVTAMAGLVGSFHVSLLFFVFPAIISLIVHWDDPGPGKYCWRIWKCAFLILFGLCTFFTCSYACLIQVIAIIKKN